MLSKSCPVATPPNIIAYLEKSNFLSCDRFIYPIIIGSESAINNLRATYFRTIDQKLQILLAVAYSRIDSSGPCVPPTSIETSNYLVRRIVVFLL